MTRIPNILSIAGSDPSGGAGIQADIKAISANGGYAMAALTALTAQNTQGVSAVETLDPGFVTAQIEAVFADIRVDAVKLGMIANAAIAEAVADCLEQHRPAHLVVDPVMVAKGGARLLAEDAVTAVRERLLPLASVITPNLPEAAALLDTDEITTRVEMPDLARRLLALGPQAVLLKGGHLGGANSPDLLLTGDGETWLVKPRIATRNTHGTGCTLSAALAARLALDGDILTATMQSREYVQAAIAAADSLSVGKGHGPTQHFHALRQH